MKIKRKKKERIDTKERKSIKTTNVKERTKEKRKRKQ